MDGASHAVVSGVEGKVSQSGGSMQGALDPLLLEAQNVMTNPMFGMDAHGMSVPATPTTPAPRLLQAVALQQVGRGLHFLAASNDGALIFTIFHFVQTVQGLLSRSQTSAVMHVTKLWGVRRH